MNISCQKKKTLQLTSDRLSDNGGVMMGMIAGVEKMVVQSSVKPVIEELHGTDMDQGCYNDPINPPKRQLMSLCELQVDPLHLDISELWSVTISNGTCQLAGRWCFHGLVVCDHAV